MTGGSFVSAVQRLALTTPGERSQNVRVGFLVGIAESQRPGRRCDPQWVANTKTSSNGTHHILIDPPPSANNKRVDIAIIKMMHRMTMPVQMKAFLPNSAKIG